MRLTIKFKGYDIKDFLGNDLQVGDTVVVAPKNYRGLVKATIEGFTPKNVRVIYPIHNDYLVKYLVPPSFIVKVDNNVWFPV